MKKRKRVDTKKQAKKVFSKWDTKNFVDVRLDDNKEPRIKVWRNDMDDEESIGELLLDVPAIWLYDKTKVRY